MKIDQALVDKIILRARLSEYGLSPGLDHKQGHLKIDGYERQDLGALALLLVDGFDEKYDLVSVFKAALETVAEELEEARLKAFKD
jgi:hypothetical protein